MSEMECCSFLHSLKQHFSALWVDPCNFRTTLLEMFDSIAEILQIATVKEETGHRVPQELPLVIGTCSVVIEGLLNERGQERKDQRRT